MPGKGQEGAGDLRRGRWLFLVVSGAVVLSLLACGKKGPPFLPKKNFGLRVAQLRCEREDGAALLTGQVVVPDGQAKDMSLVKGCRVSYTRYALENPPCEECPVQYSEHMEIGRDKAITPGGLRCRLPGIVKKGIYFFKVRLIAGDGTMGPDSNRARLAVGNNRQ